MRIANQKHWIKIEFLHFAKDSCHVAPPLIDEDNCVEIGFSYNIDDDWGCVGDEFFFTKDIKALADGFSGVLLGECDSFTHSGGYPYKSLTPDPFYTFCLDRDGDRIVVSLKIHDRLIDYISVTESMDVSRFEHIVNELKAAAKTFPDV